MASSGENEDIEIKSIKKSVDNELNKLKTLSDDEKRTKNEQIKSMINYFISLTKDIEDRRTRLYQYTLQYIVILSGAITLIFSQKANISDTILYPLIAILVIQLFFSLLILLVYEIQSNYEYIFLNRELQEYGNKWKWFYYGNKEILKINTSCFINFFSNRFRDITNKSIISYLNGLKQFINNYAKERVENELINNIQQLYLLQVHNYYKNKFHIVIIKIRLFSMILTVIGAVTSIVITYFY